MIRMGKNLKRETSRYSCQHEIQENRSRYQETFPTIIGVKAKLCYQEPSTVGSYELK